MEDSGPSLARMYTCEHSGITFPVKNCTAYKTGYMHAWEDVRDQIYDIHSFLKTLIESVEDVLNKID